MEGCKNMKNYLLDARIVIQSKENATWQGILYVDGQEHLFRSEMDLLLLINKHVGGIDGYTGWASNSSNTWRTDEPNVD